MVASRRSLAAAAVLLAGLLPAIAADAAETGRGAAGLAVVPFSVDNAGPVPIVCAAAVAHWFSLELGRAPAGGTVTAVLWADPAGGAVFVLNDVGDRLPIERLWCGIAGRGWQTRAQVALARRAGEAPPPIGLVCTPAGERLACR